MVVRTSQFCIIHLYLFKQKGYNHPKVTKYWLICWFGKMAHFLENWILFLMYFYSSHWTVQCKLEIWFLWKKWTSNHLLLPSSRSILKFLISILFFLPKYMALLETTRLLIVEIFSPCTWFSPTSVRKSPFYTRLLSCSYLEKIPIYTVIRAPRLLGTLE